MDLADGKVILPGTNSEYTSRAGECLAVWGLSEIQTACGMKFVARGLLRRATETLLDVSDGTAILQLLSVARLPPKDGHAMRNKILQLNIVLHVCQLSTMCNKMVEETMTKKNVAHCIFTDDFVDLQYVGGRFKSLGISSRERFHGIAEGNTLAGPSTSGVSLCYSGPSTIKYPRNVSKWCSRHISLSTSPFFQSHLLLVTSYLISLTLGRTSKHSRGYCAK